MHQKSKIVIGETGGAFVGRPVTLVSLVVGAMERDDDIASIITAGVLSFCKRHDIDPTELMQDPDFKVFPPL